MGMWGTSTIDGAGGQDFGGNCSSDNEVEHSDSNMDFPAHGDFDDLPSVQRIEDGRAQPHFVAPWFIIEKLARGDEDLFGVNGSLWMYQSLIYQVA